MDINASFETQEHDSTIIECFRQLWQHSADNVFIMAVEKNGEFSLYDSNPASRKTMGIAEDAEIHRLNIRKIWPEPIIEGLYSTYRQAIQAREPTSVEQTASNSHGETEYWDTLLIPIFDSNDEATFICGVSRNVTTIKLAKYQAEIAQLHAEQHNDDQVNLTAELEKQVQIKTQALNATNFELTEAYDKLFESSQSKSRFLANMSHEIRTPLTAIIGYSEAILSGVIEPAKNLDAIGSIQNNGKHLLSIINDILDLSKIEANKLNIEQSQVNLVELVQQVEKLLVIRANDKSIKLSVDYTYPLPKLIMSDAIRLKQILINIVANSIKFTSYGQVILKVEANEDDIKFVIEDTGIGITDEQLDNLFTPFSQADDSISRRFGGSGLGLSISQNLAQLLDGDISVSSQINQGSIFTIRIAHKATQPTEWITETPITSAFITPDKHQTKKLNGRVLLAEDHKDNRELISLLLKSFGLSVTEVENGELAAYNALSEPFNLILMDIQMPIMDGLTATKILRAKGYKNPIIALTANAMKNEVATYLQSGFTSHIAKPINSQTLYNSLECFFDISEDESLADLELNKKIEVIKHNFENKLSSYHHDLSQALECSDYSRIQKISHDIKGAGTAFDFEDLSQLASETELAVRSEKVSDILRHSMLLIEKLATHINREPTSEQEQDSGPKLKILITDDHQLFLDGIGYTLSEISNNIQLFKTRNTKEALAIVEQHYDLDWIFLDLQLAGDDPLQFMDVLKEKRITAPVIILSGSERADLISEALSRGASGFISKAGHSDEIIHGLKQIEQQGFYISPNTQALLEAFKP